MTPVSPDHEPLLAEIRTARQVRDAANARFAAAISAALTAHWDAGTSDAVPISRIAEAANLTRDSIYDRLRKVLAATGLNEDDNPA